MHRIISYLRDFMCRSTTWYFYKIDPEKLVHVCQELSSYSSKWRKRYNLSCSPGDPAGRVQKAAARQFLDKGANGPNFCGQTTADSEEPLVSEKDHGGVPLPVWPRWGK